MSPTAGRNPFLEELSRGKWSASLTLSGVMISRRIEMVGLPSAGGSIVRVARRLAILASGVPAIAFSQSYVSLGIRASLSHQATTGPEAVVGPVAVPLRHALALSSPLAIEAPPPPVAEPPIPSTRETVNNVSEADEITPDAGAGITLGKLLTDHLGAQVEWSNESLARQVVNGKFEGSPEMIARSALAGVSYAIIRDHGRLRIIVIGPMISKHQANTSAPTQRSNDLQSESKVKF